MPNKYPANEEKTTLNAKRIFVISLKSEITEGVANEDFELLNIFLFMAFYSECKDTLLKLFEQCFLLVNLFIYSSINYFVLLWYSTMLKMPHYEIDKNT
ncbi:hypothetical protein GCM10022397_34090 [Flavivirga jejuensis]